MSAAVGSDGDHMSLDALQADGVRPEDVGLKLLAGNNDAPSLHIEPTALSFSDSVLQNGPVVRNYSHTSSAESTRELDREESSESISWSRESAAPDSKDQQVADDTKRYPSRSKRAACPLCGKVFPNLDAHAAKCKLEDDTPLSHQSLVSEAGKKKKPKVQQSAPAPSTMAPVRRKSARPANVPSEHSIFLTSSLAMPPAAPPAVPEDEPNRLIIERERALLRAAANAAAQTAANANRPSDVELVEIEPGITMLVSAKPFKDGMGQGLAYTLRTDLANVINELHAVRESDAAVREENARLREQLEQVHHHARRAHEAELETFERDKKEFIEEARARGEEAKASREALKETTNLLANANNEVKHLEREIKAVRDEAKRHAAEAEREVKRNLELIRLNETLESSIAALKSELASLNSELQTEKKARADSAEKARVVKAELAAAQQNLILRSDEVDELRRELETGRGLGSTALDDDKPIAASLSPPTEEMDEYVDLLKAWLQTHNSSISVAALAIFHGTKDRAGALWTKLASQVPFRELILRGAAKGITFNEDETRIVLASDPVPSGDPLQLFESTDFFLGDDLLGAPIDSRVLNAEETSLVERVSSWLEEKNGYATWMEFKETFPKYEGEKQDLAHLAAAHQDEFFLLESGHLVLSNLKELVLVNLFCDYLRAQGGVAPASRYSHFMETTPGMLQIRDRLSKAESKLASIAKKFPDKVHFWRENETAMCCVAEARTRLEREKADKKRAEEEEKMEQERQRVAREKAEAEERARNEWEKRRRDAQQPPSVAPTAATPSKLVAQRPAKASRWASDASVEPSQAQPHPSEAIKAPSAPEAAMYAGSYGQSYDPRMPPGAPNGPPPMAMGAPYPSEHGYPPQPNAGPHQPVQHEQHHPYAPPPHAGPYPPAHDQQQQQQQRAYGGSYLPQQPPYSQYGQGYQQAGAIPQLIPPSAPPPPLLPPQHGGYYPPAPAAQQDYYGAPQQQNKPPSLLHYTRQG